MKVYMYGLLVLFVLEVCARPQTGGRYDVQLGGPVRERAWLLRSVIRAKRDIHAHHTYHELTLLDHILEEASQGHVTAENMEHWKHQVNDALHKGEITHEEFTEFMHKFQEITHASHEDMGPCCPFG